MTSFGEGISHAARTRGTGFGHLQRRDPLLPAIPALAARNRDLRAADQAPAGNLPVPAGPKGGDAAAVDFGTARRAGYDSNEPILGKTGTCTDFRASTHLGWFGSFNDVGRHKLVVIVLLTVGHPINGPLAAGVAGSVYRQLSQQNYFASNDSRIPLSLVATQSCRLR